MWDFLTTVYRGEEGGIGLLIAFGILCESVTRIAIAIVNRNKPQCTCEDED